MTRNRSKGAGINHAATDQMNIAEINSRIDQLRGEILAHFGIDWEKAKETHQANEQGQAKQPIRLC